MNRGWEDRRALAQVIVARHVPGGTVVAGAYLVDLACLGVKAAVAAHFDGERQYRLVFRSRIAGGQSMVPASLDLAAKIVERGLTYARDLGFSPDPDFSLARHLLDGADPDACPADVPVGGPEGKPFFCAGPDDHVGTILRVLRRRLGPDGFHYLVPA